MFIKLLLLTQMSYSVLGFDISNQVEINSKNILIQELQVEIREAQEKGTAETMDIVEKIHYVRNLQEEIKAALEAQ